MRNFALDKWRLGEFKKLAGTTLTWAAIGIAGLLQTGNTIAAPARAESWQKLADAPALFGARCGVCHNTGYVIPAPMQLARLTAAEIEDILWNGPMQEYANGLDTGQRHQLAEWISDLSPIKTPRDAGVPLCDGDQTWQKDGKASASWPGWSFDNSSQRNAIGTGFKAADAANIRLAYSIVLPIGVDDGAANPVAVVGNRIFMGNINKWVYALDAQKGCAIWTFKAQDRIRSNVAVENGVIVFGDLRANAYGLDADTGHLLWFQHVDSAPTARITGNVTLADGMVYVPISSWEEMNSWQLANPCCSFRGSVVALDAKTGVMRWRAKMIDEPLRFLGRTSTGVNRYGPAGVPVWSGISVDRERRQLYIATGNQYTALAVRSAGPQVPESDAIIALDPATGRKRWVTTMAPKETGGADFWELGCLSPVDPAQASCTNPTKEGDSDMDISTPPALVRASSGRSFLLAGTKGGIFFALNPDDGRLLWSMRLGHGGHLGGIQYGVATNGRYAFVPVADESVDPKDFEKWARVGTGGTLNAVDLETGKLVWKYQQAESSCHGREEAGCLSAFISPPTVVGEVVFAGSDDGVMHAFEIDSGKELWSYDAFHEFVGANGLKGRGGSFAFGGPAVAGGRMYVISGAGLLSFGMGGNVLLAFDLLGAGK